MSPSVLPSPKTLQRDHHREGWTDSALVAWGVAAIAFVVAAFCLASLTWDGSYGLLRTIQDGTPMIPHRRWVDWLLLEPALWARPAIRTPAGLAVVNGLMFAVLPLFSLAVCLRMLRGEFARLRFWAAIGILLVPLPGQMVFCAEVNIALQLAWVCFAFVWRGCPGRWASAVAVSGMMMWGLHPVAAPLFFLAAATAAAMSFAVDSASRRRLRTWAALFGIASLAKAAETLAFASDYERANMHGSAWLAECFSAFLLTPLVVLIPVLIDAGWRLWSSPRADKPRVSKWLWGAAGVLGIIYGLYPGGWAGSLSYRKFGVLVATPVVILATLDAWRHWQPGGRHPASPRPLIYPALLFAVVLCCMSFSWKSLCGSLLTHLASHRGPVQFQEELPPLERDSALNHWATTSLSLVLQGWKPDKVHVWNRQLQLPKEHFRMCPEDDFSCEDKAFKLAWLAKLAEQPQR